MQILNSRGFLAGLLVKALPFLGYKGVVSHQIRIYKKLKDENSSAFKAWAKTAKPSVNIESLTNESGLRNDATVGDIKKFRQENAENKFVPSYSENDILNIILDTRRKFDAQDLGADGYYTDLIQLPNKTLEQVIMAIVEWEYLSNMRAYAIRGEHNIPNEFIESFRQEASAYIHNRVSNI